MKDFVEQVIPELAFGYVQVRESIRAEKPEMCTGVQHWSSKHTGSGFQLLKTPFSLFPESFQFSVSRECSSEKVRPTFITTHRVLPHVTLPRNSWPIKVLINGLTAGLGTTPCRTRVLSSRMQVCSEAKTCV